MHRIDPPARLAQRIENILHQLTLAEKVSLLSGRDLWNTQPLERLGLPALTMTDGPHGVRANASDAGRKAGPATAFPTGSALASTWNPALIERVGVALAEETLALECDILLGPCVNIMRAPLTGRNFESYSEDPYLAGRIGAAWVKGLQSQGVGASLKHFAGNNYETERFRANTQVDERALREIYLAQFEMIVKETQPWTVMCAYNRLNGVYCSEHPYLLNEILRREWGFAGAVISDWGANHTITASVQGGLDLEMPGPARYYGPLLVEAVNLWQIEEAVIDQAARRILRLLLLSGKLDQPDRYAAGKLNTPEHQHLARETAEEAIVLLKNEKQTLPLRPERLRTLAVIGPNALLTPISGGGSAHLEPPYRVNALDALRAKLDPTTQVEYEAGYDYVMVPTLSPASMRQSDGQGPGWQIDFFDNLELAGPPVYTALSQRCDQWWGSNPPRPHLGDQYSVRWSGKFVATHTGPQLFQIYSSHPAQLYMNETLLVDGAGDDRLATQILETVAGQAYTFRLEFKRVSGAGNAFIHLRSAPSVPADSFQRAVALARRCDAVVLFAGMPEAFETEGEDTRDPLGLALPGQQAELIQAVALANPQTVVVVNCGAPFAMPWLEAVPAVVDMLYAGMEGGNAIANVLLGQVNPSGKLTVTFPRRLEDTPASLNATYPGARTVTYGEGVFVGYRYYDAKAIAPLFPFGHGLSYTTFAYSDLRLPAKVSAGAPVPVAVTVKNTGPCAGQEVVQLYVADQQASVPRPPQELKGFAKVALQPGEAQTVQFTLDERALAFYDVVTRQWVAEPGEFEVRLGSSSRDIRARATFVLG